MSNSFGFFLILVLGLLPDECFRDWIPFNVIFWCNHLNVTPGLTSYVTYFLITAFSLPGLRELEASGSYRWTGQTWTHDLWLDGRPEREWYKGRHWIHCCPVGRHGKWGASQDIHPKIWKNQQPNHLQVRISRMLPVVISFGQISPVLCNLFCRAHMVFYHLLCKHY